MAKLTKKMRNGVYVLQKIDGFPALVVRLYPAVFKITINGRRYSIDPRHYPAVDENIVRKIADRNNCTYFRVSK